jgi:CRP-like cAMP-binding protein
MVVSGAKKFWENLKIDAWSKQVPCALILGTIIGFFEVIFAISLASSLFGAQLQLRDMGMDKDAAKRLTAYLEKRQLKPDEPLIQQDDEANDLYFVQIGQLSIFLESDDGQRLRLRTMTMGTLVGEISFYLNTKRSATVIADMFSVVYRLSAVAMEEMKTKDPELVIALNELIIRILANRLVSTNQAMVAMT